MTQIVIVCLVLCACTQPPPLFPPLHHLPCICVPAAGRPQYLGAIGIYAMKALRYAGLDKVLDFVPQLIQALRYDAYGLLEEFLLDISSRSDIFAHRLIWNLQGEEVGVSGGL